MSDGAVFPIDLSGNAEERAVAVGDSLERLKAKADASFKAIAEGNAKLKDLKGTSEEVVKIKETLNAKLLIEKQNVGAAALAIVKQGTSLKDLQTQGKAAAKAADDHAKKQKGLGDAIGYIGGPADEARSKLTGLKEVLGSGNAGVLALGAGLALLAAAAVAVAGAIATATIALVKFALAGGDANRSLALSRQWIAGSAADSARMGDQIDALRQKIPLTTAEMSKLYTSTRASFDGSLASGKDILGLVTAIGAATGAGADAAAAKVKEIAERSKNFGRVRIDDGKSNGFSAGTGGKGELAGTGLNASAFAESVSQTLNVPLEKAKQILRTTGVDMATYAKAAVYATNKAFGEINAAKLISADAIANRFHDDLQALTKGVNWDPIGNALSRIEKAFSTSTTSGYGLKEAFTAIGNAFGGIAKDGAPLLETAIRVTILEFTKLVTAAIKTEVFLKQTFGKGTLSGAERMRDVVILTKVAIGAAAVVAGVLSAALVTAAGSALLLASPFIAAYEAAKALYDLVDKRAGTVGGGGKQIGVSGGTSSLSGPAGKGGTIVAPANAEGGLVMRPAPGEAFASVAPGERIVPASDAGGRRGGGAPVINVSINVQAHGASGAAVAEGMRSSGMIAQLTKAIEDALKGAGVPTQAVPT